MAKNKINVKTTFVGKAVKHPKQLEEEKNKK